jgi:hypothetical protein
MERNIHGAFAFLHTLYYEFVNKSTKNTKNESFVKWLSTFYKRHYKGSPYLNNRLTVHNSRYLSNIEIQHFLYLSRERGDLKPIIIDCEISISLDCRIIKLHCQKNGDRHNA